MKEGEPPELEEGEEPPTLPEFDQKYYIYSYDEEKPEIIIPDEIEDDKDNDWLIEQTFKDEQVAEYFAQVTEAVNAGQNPAPPGKKW